MSGISIDFFKKLKSRSYYKIEKSSSHENRNETQPKANEYKSIIIMTSLEWRIQKKNEE